MLHVIGPPCLGAKHGDCTDVCPVDCIHPAPWEDGFDAAAQLYIDPEECIGCGACVTACPVDAIVPLADLPADWADVPAINAAYYA